LICDPLSSAELRRCGGRTDAVFFTPEAVGSNPGEMIPDLHEADLFPAGLPFRQHRLPSGWTAPTVRMGYGRRASISA